ncbi:MAG: ABC transporter ATP-binding protein [Treponema sp.]|nr:ABC transporter ATP-binding protein [Candidatus Treponema equifaecale]
MKTKLELKNICYSFGETAAVKNFSLVVEEGSFTTLLGPSGCGKTTLLRLISGFLEPNSGEVLIDGKNQKGIEVNHRKIGIVFQDYALFPHMTVQQNLLYGLKIKGTQKISKSEAQKLIQETADSLGIQELLNRYPHELSGGQQQRVALGRSLVLKPEILLMDEPLSSLDTKLRTKVREELKEIQQQLGITTIYVTHDQEEALSLSTKIAVINKGQLLQEGSPREIYFEPQDKFTADFVGKANFINENGCTKMIRPEWFELVDSSSNFAAVSALQNLPAVAEDFFVEGKIVSEAFLGSRTRFLIETNENSEKITADLETITTTNLKIGNKIKLRAKKIHTIASTQQ